MEDTILMCLVGIPAVLMLFSFSVGIAVFGIKLIFKEKEILSGIIMFLSSFLVFALATPMLVDLIKLFN
jgi:hypothetical protein